jgi:PASTA domain
MADLADRLADMSRRSEHLQFYGLCVGFILVMATAFILDIRERLTPLEPRNAASVTSSRAATHIDIPDVRGMPASDARGQLERAGLKFAGAEATIGTPGQVLWTRPAIGRRVASDTPVTIVVGVDARRFVLETSGL